MFNTNEQRTATIGRVPRVGKMSSFYGAADLAAGERVLPPAPRTDRGKQAGDSLRVPTVYRVGSNRRNCPYLSGLWHQVGSLHLSEGVYGTSKGAVPGLGGSTPNLLDPPGPSLQPGQPRKAKSGILFSSQQTATGRKLRLLPVVVFIQMLKSLIFLLHSQS